MRLVINSLLFLLTIGLVYVLYSSIFEPIKFRVEKQKRERAVIDRLMKIRDAQSMHLDITGKYASSFDSLQYALENGRFMFINIEGDPDDPNFTDFKRDTIYQNAIDSVRSLEMDLTSLRKIPYSDGQDFAIFADTITYEKSLVNVVEVGSTYKNFMGPYALAKYARYDNRYDPNRFIKFGDKNKPVLTGNWEQ